MIPLTLLETIKIEDGNIVNLSYHQARCTKSRKILFNAQETLQLSSSIKAPPFGLWRCRILYAQTIQSIEYIPYAEKEVHTLKIISSNIEYAHKYADRTTMNTLVDKYNDYDDILIEKGGHLTDTSIANIAFFDGTQWLTPKIPLLEGTLRAKLLDEGLLQTRDIKKEDLKHYTQVALMNAMLGFKILESLTIQDSEGNTYDY